MKYFSSQRACPISKCTPLLYFRSLVRLSVYSHDWGPSSPPSSTGTLKRKKPLLLLLLAQLATCFLLVLALVLLLALPPTPSSAVEAAVNTAPDDPSEDVYTFKNRTHDFTDYRNLRSDTAPACLSVVCEQCVSVRVICLCHTWANARLVQSQGPYEGSHDRPACSWRADACLHSHSYICVSANNHTCL